MLIERSYNRHSACSQGDFILSILSSKVYSSVDLTDKKEVKNKNPINSISLSLHFVRTSNIRQMTRLYYISGLILVKSFNLLSFG